MSREIVYLGRDNTIDWQLQADSVAVDLASVTRMVLQIGDVTIDSDTDGMGEGNPFYWTGGVPTEGVANLFLTLGGAELASGIQDAKLIVYDPDHAAGLVWTVEKVKVVA